jgi:hypothetical protein
MSALVLIVLATDLKLHILQTSKDHIKSDGNMLGVAAVICIPQGVDVSAHLATNLGTCS